jgi:hypothetical protein
LKIKVRNTTTGSELFSVIGHQNQSNEKQLGEKVIGETWFPGLTLKTLLN